MHAPTAGPARRSLALLVLLPLLALLLPWGPGGRPVLAADPTPDASAAAWVLLAAGPAVLALVAAGGAALGGAWPRGLGLLAVALGVVFLGRAGLAGLGPGSDTFEADASLARWSAAAVLLTVGAALDPRARQFFVNAAPLVGLAVVVSAPFAGPLALGPPGTWTGLLGNTGDISELALPAGVLGLGLFLHGPAWARPLGLAAALSHGLYSGLVPVHAGTAGWLAVTLVAFVAAPRRREARRLARLALVVTCVAVAAFGIRTAFSGPTAASAGASANHEPGTAESATQAPPHAEAAAPGQHRPASDTAELGGVGFRLATWRATADLVGGHPAGVGAGQFRAAFPPFRDADELERSSHGRAEPTPVEVEHPHHDTLLALAELGVVGGGAFALLLLAAAFHAVRALRGEDPVLAAAGLAVLAILVNGLVNTPLLSGTASLALGWPLLGMVLGRRESKFAASSAVRRGLPLALGLLVVLQLRAATSLVEHGRALSGIVDARVVVDGREEVAADLLGPVLSRALAARGDSVVALEKRHELLRATGAPAETRRALLERILTARPLAFAARLSSGNLAAAEGRLADAEEHYAAAARADAGNPVLAQNRFLLALDSRDAAAVTQRLDELASRGLLDGEELERRAAEQLLRGRLEVAKLLLERWSGPKLDAATHSTAAAGDLRYDPTDADAAFRASRVLREFGHELLADGLLCASQVLFARSLRAEGNHERAVAMARQALQRAEGWPGLPGGHGALRLELAASYAAALDAAGARDVLARAPIPTVDWQRLPADDRERLLGTGAIEVRGGQIVVPER